LTFRSQVISKEFDPKITNLRNPLNPLKILQTHRLELGLKVKVCTGNYLLATAGNLGIPARNIGFLYCINIKIVIFLPEIKRIEETERTAHETSLR